VEVQSEAAGLREAGARLDPEELQQHCRAHLASFKVPRQLFLRESLTRNPSGKVLKRVLRDELAGSGAT